MQSGPWLRWRSCSASQCSTPFLSSMPLSPSAPSASMSAVRPLFHPTLFCYQPGCAILHSSDEAAHADTPLEGCNPVMQISQTHVQCFLQVSELHLQGMYGHFVGESLKRNVAFHRWHPHSGARDQAQELQARPFSAGQVASAHQPGCSLLGYHFIGALTSTEFFYCIDNQTSCNVTVS